MPISERALYMALPGLKGERVMLNTYNIKDIISDHQREIDEIRAELTITHTPHARKALEDRISYLQDNMYRYKLQAKAWEIEI